MPDYLASDMNNPEFVGASNPDGALAVKFYTVPLKNEWKSGQEGRPIYEDIDMIEIMIPGNQLSIVAQPVREDHKQRFPKQWAHFQNKTAGDVREVGTPLKQWPQLTPSQVEELRALKFFTVDSIAHASDLQIQGIGMLAGVSPFVFRDSARRYLRIAQDNAALEKAEERAKVTEEKLAAETTAREEMEAKMLAMQEQLAALAPKKRGRPKKVAIE